jgi:hypothetical protein
MSAKRSVFGLLSLMLAVVVAIFFAGSPAQAATSSSRAASVASRPSTGNQILIAPAAPAGLRSAAVHPDAVAPTTSPSVSTSHAASGTAYTCYSGDLCAVAWDPTTSSWKIFYLYECELYSLSYWSGDGNYYDNQSSSAHSYFYGESGNVLSSFYPQYTNVAYDWTPVYSIRNC